MVWCPSCEDEVEADYNDSAAMTCCSLCGRVLEDTAFSSDVTFMKGADGEGELVGQFVGERGEVRGLQRMAGGKVWSMRVSRQQRSKRSSTTAAHHLKSAASTGCSSSSCRV
jgi:transcription initiation factor TFIIIB Brf1 subunit/transcription initiation factor TFIIB